MDAASDVHGQLPAASLPGSEAPVENPILHSNSTANTDPAPDSVMAGHDGDANHTKDGPSGKAGPRGPEQNRGKKRKDWGRNEPIEKKDRREKLNRAWHDQKRRKVGEEGNAVQAQPSLMSIQFPEEEIAAEERRPKRKVAVMIGYAGTGYHGLQINHKDKTIEGDIFAALVAAKAISKANASDPRKSSFVRCARTDKGVHAAGNMISLKLIIEDPDVVEKINEHLPPQIRVWGIQRTNNKFSCYSSCDSRWYEYLMPSYCLLPPHPGSHIGKSITEWAREKAVDDERTTKLGDMKDFWDEVDNNEIKTILDGLEPDVREKVTHLLHSSDTNPPIDKAGAEPDDRSKDEDAADREQIEPSSVAEGQSANESELKDAMWKDGSTVAAELATAPAESISVEAQSTDERESKKPAKELSPVDRALRDIKEAYIAAKRRYRVTPERLAQLQEALGKYVGTKNYHNYTVQKTHADPSAKRVIKSFKVDPKPIRINDTEWLSLKVHGQSFMMHQIRKMVAMAVLVVRCGTPSGIVDASYTAARISIPKAPSLGLLLERPVFDSYNARARETFGLETLDFGAYEAAIREFKDAQIYKRIFELEEKENSFHSFFHQIDNFKSNHFLWVTAGGLEAAKTRVGPGEPVPAALKEELGDEGDVADGEGEG